MAENPLARIYVMYDGIYLAPFDVIKGIISGVVAYGAVDALGISIKDFKDAMVKGFILGGVFGGLEELLDASFSLAIGQRFGVGDATVDAVVHELFQSIFLNGILTGITLSALKKLLG